MDYAGTSEIVISLLTLTSLEIILGIDNIVMLTILVSRLPKYKQTFARSIGLTLAWLTRLLLLASAVYLSKLTTPLFHVLSHNVSLRDIFLFSGGLFLVYKALQEIKAELQPQFAVKPLPSRSTFFWVVTQIALLDIVFSLDSVLTAIGLTQLFWIMATAITIAIIIMLFFSHYLSRLIEAHPPIKMLAFCFIILVGSFLISDALQYHTSRNYLYCAVGFSCVVELLNYIQRTRHASRDANM